METLKTILAVAGIISVVLLIFALIRMMIALWRHDPNDFYNISPEALREDLVKFGQIVNDHWLEKTRWIPVEERLPVFGGERRTILVKTGENLYAFLWIMQELSLSDFECQQYTHWKEIE